VAFIGIGFTEFNVAHMVPVAVKESVIISLRGEGCIAPVFIVVTYATWWKFK
jgi:hypothetical protein